MRKITLYIAMSLDGFVAGTQDELDWLIQFPNPEQTDYGYAAFLETIDTTLMGYRTYEVVLGLEETFPYANLTNYVFTRSTSRGEAPYVSFVTEDWRTFVQNLKQQPGKGIWLIGGGQLNAAFLNEKRIDELIVHVMPVVLGSGISLFEGLTIEHTLQLTSTKSYHNGVLELQYHL
ncbi:dihydrofolate reductase family protein [Siphonobacter sp.]|uniref:dihydrofolate reductase family protein n=1 Tax=Siphonobacter sp. TaxID=1869184 RepID=UPI003B3B7ED2